MTACYRIYTEDKNWNTVKDLVAQFFDGATILDGTGLWEGKEESCTVIELIIDATVSNGIQVRMLCDHIKQANNQRSVLLTRSYVDKEAI